MHAGTIAILSSGSCGNSMLVTLDDITLMVDAGLSCRELERRMSMIGRDPSSVDALLVTHEHTDHMRGAQRYCASHEVPVYATEGTFSLMPLEGISREIIPRDGAFRVGSVAIRAVPVRHLAAEPVGFTMSVDGTKIGVASDLGSSTAKVERAFGGCRMLLVEANYDDHMLMTGTYPDFLKRTIRSSQGHLSNDDSGALCAKVSHDDLERIVLLHLSRENNTTEIASSTVRSALKASGCSANVDTIEHGGSLGPITL